MRIKNWKKEILSIPNLLSLFRLMLIPVYMTLYLRAKELSDYFVAGAILAVSCMTDAIDGKIARHFNMITTLGKILDPMADKATQFALTVCVAVKYPILWFIVGLFICKEGFQLIAGIITFRKGKMLTGALISGKICTTILFLSLIVLVLIPNLDIRIVYCLAAADAAAMIVAFLGYARTYYTQSPMIQELDVGDDE